MRGSSALKLLWQLNAGVPAAVHPFDSDMNFLKHDLSSVISHRLATKLSRCKYVLPQPIICV